MYMYIWEKNIKVGGEYYEKKYDSHKVHPRNTHVVGFRSTRDVFPRRSSADLFGSKGTLISMQRFQRPRYKAAYRTSRIFSVTGLIYPRETDKRNEKFQLMSGRFP